jgi:hypothetical protein
VLGEKNTCVLILGGTTCVLILGGRQHLHAGNNKREGVRNVAGRQQQVTVVASAPKKNRREKGEGENN